MTTVRRHPGFKARPVMERIAEKLVVRESGCIEWVGNRDSKGYGRINIGSMLDNSCRLASVHRLVWADVHGEIPAGMVICHHCDNPPCCNIDHLFLGTQIDNIQDMVRKGRARAPVGEGHHKSRLTREQVAEIRSAAARGESRASISKRYPVTHWTISDVVLRRTWRSVP